MIYDHNGRNVLITDGNNTEPKHPFAIVIIVRV